ncbi:MAG: hypothetical protein LW698_14425 [Planctomycetaceae bacterium]|jgi:hypothetical protein|nr:hypothetical protein [Planctomycetaceae bacterium]
MIVHRSSLLVAVSLPRLMVVMAVAAVGLTAVPASAQAPATEAGPETRVFTIADRGFSLQAPAGWQRVQPKSGIVETEFAIPSEGAAADGTPAQPGRMTVMGAGGTVQANIDRWYGQFVQPDGSETKTKATTKKLDLAGCKVTLVDIPGTYKDSPGGPFAGGRAVERPDYRMLAAIVETPDRGNHFLKFYGPAKTVAAHADGFRTMVEGMVAAGK